MDLKELGGPITWEVAYREIKGNTEFGVLILNKLSELNFININDGENR